MSMKKFQVGAVFPQFEIEHDPIIIRDFAQALEGMGFDHLVAYDHVLGASQASRPDWRGPYDSDHAFYEPFTLFSYLAGLTRTIGLVSGIFVLPQRQTALFAKQAACTDVLSGGRLRLGVSIGWNPVEYEALGIPFSQRARRMEEQIDLLRRFWTEPTLSADSEFHTVTDAGINPLPVQRPIPIWIGGGVDAAMDRAARIGDGYLGYGDATNAARIIDYVGSRAEAAGRNPADVGVENITFIGSRKSEARTPEAAAEDAAIWREAGAAAVSFETLFLGKKTAQEHLAILERVARTLGL
jgi:probable F420-dependent oxidoreductase